MGEIRAAPFLLKALDFTLSQTQLCSTFPVQPGYLLQVSQPAPVGLRPDRSHCSLAKTRTSSHAHSSKLEDVGVAITWRSTPPILYVTIILYNMAVTLLGAIAACFWWFVDVLICFLVSSSVVIVVGIALVVFYKLTIDPSAANEERPTKLMKKYETAIYRGRVAMVSSPFLFLLIALFWRVWDIVMNDGTIEQYSPCASIPLEDEPLDLGSNGGCDNGMLISEVMPTWFLPFWIIDDFELDVAIVSFRMTKVLFVSAFFLSFPLFFVTIHFVSKSERPIVKLALWLVKMYHRLTNASCRDHTARIMYLEYTEEQYMKTILRVTLSCMQKEKEVEQLEKQVNQLQENIADMNRWMYSERRLANNFDRKNRDIERQLQSERRRAQSYASKNEALEKKLEMERKMVTTWERKFNEVQKRLSAVERRPLVVKQQVSGDDIMCVICMERKRQFLLRPCNHYCVCNTCKSTLQNKCPLCRKLIRSYEKIYIS